MKFSFVTPTYNRADLLLETIESIFESVRFIPALEFELVIVDDASNDNTEDKIYKTYSDFIKDGTIVYDRLSKNQGVTAAKNRGVEIATGDWVVFIDSDDLIIPSSFEDFFKIIKAKSNYSAMFFSCEDFEGRRIGDSFESKTLTLEDYIKKGTYGEKLPVLKREIALNFPYINELRGFEGISYYRILLSGNRIWLSDFIVRRYRTDNNDRLSTSLGRLRRSSYLSSGYSLLLNDFKSHDVRSPFYFRVKRLSYAFLALFFGRN